LSKVLWFLS